MTIQPFEDATRVGKRFSAAQAQALEAGVMENRSAHRDRYSSIWRSEMSRAGIPLLQAWCHSTVLAARPVWTSVISSSTLIWLSSCPVSGDWPHMACSAVSSSHAAFGIAAVRKSAIHETGFVSSAPGPKFQVPDHCSASRGMPFPRQEDTRPAVPEHAAMAERIR